MSSVHRYVPVFPFIGRSGPWCGLLQALVAYAYSGRKCAAGRGKGGWVCTRTDSYGAARLAALCALCGFPCTAMCMD